MQEVRRLITVAQASAPFVGAVLLEATHWYQLREENLRPEYQKMLRSVSYWVITTVFTIIAPLAILIFFHDQPATQLLIDGAAAPTIAKKLISAACPPAQLTPGPDDESTVRLSDYFRTGG